MKIICIGTKNFPFKRVRKAIRTNQNFNLKNTSLTLQVQESFYEYIDILKKRGYSTSEIVIDIVNNFLKQSKNLDFEYTSINEFIRTSWRFYLLNKKVRKSVFKSRKEVGKLEKKTENSVNSFKNKIGSNFKLEGKNFKILKVLW